MPDSVLFRVVSAELKAHFIGRAAHYSTEAQKHDESAKNSTIGDYAQSVRQKAQAARSRAASYRFAAEHLDPGIEHYLLSWNDLERYEFIPCEEDRW